MPHLKKKSLVSVALVALTASAWLAPLPALGQLFDRSLDRFGRPQSLNPQRPDAAEIDSNSLRGGFEPDGETSGVNNEDLVRRAQGRDALIGADDAAPVLDAGNEGVVPEAERAEQQRARQLTRNNEAEQDPFAALGIRVGSFLLFPEISAESVYSDNIFLSSDNPQGDWALELTPRLTVRSDWSRHSLIGTLSAVRSYYDRFPTEDEETFSADVTGQIDIRRNTNLVAEARYTQSLGDRSDTDFPSGAAERSQERAQSVSLEGNQTFNRVTLTLRGRISEQDFDDGLRNDGSIINNDDRDYTERRLTGRAGYEFQPGVVAFIEASTNERDFAERIDDGGTISGSSGYDIQGGLSFQLTGKLTGEVSAGYALQTPDDPALDDVDGLIFNAGLEWLATGLTTVRFDASSTVAETTQTGSAGSIVRGARVSVEHRPRRKIVLGASAAYETEEFSGSDNEDEEWRFAMTGEYIFTRSLAVTLAYRHLKSTSSTPDSDYDDNEVRIGLRVRR